MTPEIHELAARTVQLLVAGEVFVSPLSIVRELVDNAVDAGATEVGVRLEEGGYARIAVSDDGCGIAKTAMQTTLCQPHTTTKSQNATLGFRGEALAALSHLADLTISSKNDAAAVLGYSGTYRDGALSGGAPVALAQRGTTVEVTNIFKLYGLRRKHTNPLFERKLIIQYISDLAIYYVGRVAFRLTDGTATLVATPPHATGRPHVICALYPAIRPADLKPIRFAKVWGTADGFVLYKQDENAAINRCVVFVNGRHVNWPALERVIKLTYESFMSHTTNVFTFWDFTLTVDVDDNVDRKKLNVAIKDEHYVLQEIGKQLRENLITKAIPETLMTQTTLLGMRPSPAQLGGQPSPPRLAAAAQPPEDAAPPTPRLEDTRAINESTPVISPQPRLSVRRLHLSSFKEEALTDQASQSPICDRIAEVKESPGSATEAFSQTDFKEEFALRYNAAPALVDLPRRLEDDRPADSPAPAANTICLKLEDPSATEVTTPSRLREDVRSQLRSFSYIGCIGFKRFVAGSEVQFVVVDLERYVREEYVPAAVVAVELEPALAVAGAAEVAEECLAAAGGQVQVVPRLHAEPDLATWARLLATGDTRVCELVLEHDWRVSSAAARHRAGQEVWARWLAHPGALPAPATLVSPSLAAMLRCFERC